MFVLSCSGGVPRNEAAFGRGTGTIWMDQLQCTGSESSLEHCSFGGWGSHDCTHWEDAGVECNNMTTNITSTQGKRYTVNSEILR